VHKIQYVMMQASQLNDSAWTMLMTVIGLLLMIALYTINVHSYKSVVVITVHRLQWP